MPERGAIRSDLIWRWYNFDWIGIWYQFYLISNQLRFYSISIRFDSICNSCDVLLLINQGLDWFDSICCTSCDALLLYPILIMWEESNWNNRKSHGGEVWFDPIVIWCRFGTNSTQFWISFDSILFQFDSIRFAPPVTFLLLLVLVLLLFNLV
jgi:hypothetical protein